MDKVNIELIKELTEVHGVSGFEEEVKAIMKKHLANYAEIESDNLGSIICKKVGTSRSPKIMLPGHMDEIGFMVSNITKQGFIKFVPVGGWWEQVLLSQKVIIKTDKGDVPGVIGSTPPHIMTPEARKKVVQTKEMFIDVGAADETEAKEILGIKPGDPIVPDSSFQVMKTGKMIMAKALDDRLGCALLIELLQSLSGTEHPNTIYGAGTVQEEVGLRGAKTSAAVIDPDICITLDVAIAGDTPGIDKDEVPVVLGKGPALFLFDRSLIAHRKLRNLVIETANEEKIPLQFTTMLGGGQDGGSVHLHGSGVPTVALGIPTRYIHSHTGVIHLDDYQHTLKLLKALVLKLDEEQLKKIKTES